MTWWGKYIGRPFAEKGRGPKQFDCWGLVRWVYLNDRTVAGGGIRYPARVELPSYDELYQSTNDRDTLGRVIFQERQRRWAEVKEPQEFDVILLRMRGVPMHVGIVTQPGHMLHCAHGIGTVHERFDSMRWSNKVLGFFRYE